MKLTTIVLPATLVLSLGTALPSAWADPQPRGNRSGGPAVSRSTPRQSPSRPAGRPQTGPRYSVPSRAVAPPHQAVRRTAPPYASFYYARPYYGLRPYSYAPRYYGHRYYGYPIYYARPYYTFRPRLSIGFGIWAGYPVPYLSFGVGYGYPYAYPYPYAYAPPPYPVYGYPAYSAPAATVTVAPGASTVTQGGLSFEITPADAAVYVDGAYVGEVGQFTPNSPPLALAPGRHRVEVQAAGHETLVFDVDITAGQVLPYRGALQPRQP